MNKVNLTASFVQKYKKGNKLDIHIKKKNRNMLLKYYQILHLLLI